MARLPTPGLDNGSWGDILNDFLSQTLKSDGLLKANSVTASALAPGSVTASALATNAIGSAALSDGSVKAATLDTTNNPGADQVLAYDGSFMVWRAPGSAPVSSVSGRTGAVVLDKGDVGLSSVDNTSDAAKNSAIATLTNKSISGGSNSITNIPQSAVTNLTTDLAGKAAASHTHTASQISDSTATGRAVLAAADAAAARTAIGAGTSSLVIGTTSSTAKAGDYVPTKADVGLGNVDNTSDTTKNAAAVVLTNKTISGASNTFSNIPQSAVTNLTSDLAGKAATSHTHTASQISDSTATGRAVLAAADAAAARSAIGAGTSNLVLGTSSTTAKAGDYAPTKADVGLGNVDNTSDLSKPISTATKAYVDGRTPKITVSTTAPSSPSVGDIWVDSN